MELGLASRPMAVQNSASLSLRLPNQPDRPLPPHTSIIQAYEIAQQELLVLGEPGAGKSTLLLELACHLVEQAKQDTTQPLPILLPLSSWASNRRPLYDWLSEQLSLLYDVPRRLSQQWLQAEQILPLLDGLDEMEALARADCIAAINFYHREHLQPLVVCSRTIEYESATTRERLALHSAVVVQPLSPEQIDAYLENIGRPLAALRAALQKNIVLRDLTTTPLMLQILMLAYHDTSVRELSHKEAQLRQQIWDDYVQRMVSRKGDARSYPLNATITWLSWLAQEMRKHNQTIFFLEEFQPDWLPKGKRVFYHWCVGLLSGLLGGLSGGLFFGLFFGLLGGLLGGLFFGLLVGLFFGLFFGLLSGLGFGLFFGLQEKIKPAEVLVWSWEGLKTGLGFGILFGLSVGLLFGLFSFILGGPSFGLFVGLLFGLLFGLPCGLLFGLLSGLSGKQLIERHAFSPNEGMRRSVKNGLLILLNGLLSGLLSGLLFGLLSGLLSGLLGGLPVGLRFGPLFGLLGGLPIGLRVGLGAVVQHYTLRFWLWRAYTFPWKAVSFLEDATTRILLRRVGGGYSFTHHLLLEYFANSRKKDS